MRDSPYVLSEAPLPYGPWWQAYRRLVDGPDDPPLVPVALAFSHILQGGDTWPEAEARLQALEDLAVERVRGMTARHGAVEIVELLADEGFEGDEDTYEDPPNSFLDRVLERSRGLPISLSVVAIHLARHAGVPLQGVGFPGHFVVGLDLDAAQPLVLDPFSGGRVLGSTELSAMLLRALGRPGDWRRFLAPASSRDIVTRMLRNLMMHLRHAKRPEHAAAAQQLLRLTSAPDRRTGERRPD